MKTFLEVLVADDGRLHMRTDYAFYDDVCHPAPSKSAAKKQNESMNRMLIEGIIPALWERRETQADKAIRYLSMAEIIATAEPYDHAENLWHALMFDYIPRYEKLADRLKIPFGFDPSKVVRPIVGDGTSIMQMSDKVFSCCFPGGGSFPPSGTPMPVPGFGMGGFGPGFGGFGGSGGGEKFS